MPTGARRRQTLDEGRSRGALLLAVAAGLVTLEMLALPTARHLSRRLLLTGSILLAWTPLLWWLPLGVAGVLRTDVLLGAGAGAIVVWVGAGPWRDRARRLVPRVRTVDA